MLALWRIERKGFVMVADPHLVDLIEQRARKGDGASVIAYAILALAYEQGRLVVAVDKCGMNIYQAAGPPGALEKIAMELTELNGIISEWVVK